MVTDFYLQFQGFFADISNMLPDIFLSVRFCFICMVFCIPIKPRPRIRACNKRNITLLLYGKQNSAAAVFSEKPLRRESSQSHSQSQRRGSESEGFKSAVSRHFRRDFTRIDRKQTLRPQCSIRFRLRNRSKAWFCKKKLRLYTKRRVQIMKTCAIVGINWGDEGKGRMVDLVAGRI